MLCQVLKIRYQDDRKKKIALHVPASIRFKVMEMTDIKIEGGSARMRAVMSLSLILGGLGEATIKKIIENLKIRINHEEILDLNPANNSAI